jgi:hypothetical protein
MLAVTPITNKLNNKEDYNNWAPITISVKSEISGPLIPQGLLSTTPMQQELAQSEDLLKNEPSR